MIETLTSFLSFGLTTAGSVAAGAGSLLFLAILLAKAYRRVVEPNEVHIVQSRHRTSIYGKQFEQDEDGESRGNSYYEWPHWWPVVGVQRIILPLSVFDQNLLELQA